MIIRNRIGKMILYLGFPETMTFINVNPPQWATNIGYHKMNLSRTQQLCYV